MALDGDERLIVNLEARTKDLERAMAKAKGTVNKDFGAIERRAKQSASRMEASLGSVGAKAGASMKALAASFAGGFAAGGIIEITRNLGKMVSGIAEVGDAAKRSGLSSTAFQEWSFVAKQNRIEIDALTDGFKELSLRADEFIVTGGGSAAESFERLGFTADQLKVKLKDPSKLMLEIIGRLQSLGKASQIRIADELFGGTGGERFVQLISQGEAGLRQTIARAHELGAVFDAEVIRQAEELDRKFGELGTRMNGIFKVAMVDLATMVGLIERAREPAAYDSGRTAQMLGPDVAGQLDATGQVGSDTPAIIEDVSISFADLNANAGTLVLSLSDASNMMAGLGNTGAANQMQSLASETADAVAQFQAGKISGDELQTALSGIIERAQATIGAMSELDQARLSGVTSAVGGLLSAIAAIPGQVASAANSIRQLNNLKPQGIDGHAARAEAGAAPGAAQ